MTRHRRRRLGRPRARRHRTHRAPAAHPDRRSAPARRHRRHGHRHRRAARRDPRRDHLDRRRQQPAHGPAARTPPRPARPHAHPARRPGRDRPPRSPRRCAAPTRPAPAPWSSSTATATPLALVREAAIVGVPEHRRPWVAVSGLAQDLTDGMRVSAELAGEALLDNLRATPATEYLVVEETGEIYGVLSTTDVERAFVPGDGPPSRQFPRPVGWSHVRTDRCRPPTRALQGRGPGPAHRPQGPPLHLHARGREEVPHPQGFLPARRADRRSRGQRCPHHGKRRLPRAAPPAPRLRPVHAPRRRRGLPQGRGADPGDGRHLPRRPRRRGGRRLRLAQQLPAARHRRPGHAALLRAPRGLRRDRPAERRALLRRPAPRLAAHRRRPPGQPVRRPTSTASSWTCSPPGSAWRPSPRRWCPAASSAATSPPPPSSPAPSSPSASIGGFTEPPPWEIDGPQLARRGPGRPPRPPDDRPHRLPASPPAASPTAWSPPLRRRRPAKGAYGEDYTGPGGRASQEKPAEES